jgi:hypothetical protein
MLAVVAFVAIYLSTGQSTPLPDTTLPQASPTTTTATTRGATTTDTAQLGADLDPSPRMSRLLEEGNMIWEALLGIDGEFVVVLGTKTGSDQVQVSRERSLVQLDLPIWDVDTLAFDHSGQHMAFIGTSPIDDGPALYVGSDPALPIAQNAPSFEWHATIGGRIAWLADAREPQLCWADIGESDDPIEPECLPGPALRYQLVGFDESGFLAIDRAGRSIIQIGLDGGTIASVTGDDVARGPLGTTLIVERDPRGAGTVFTTTDAQFANPQRLDWAPPTADGSPVVAAWSPSVTYPEIAFLTWENNRFQLQVWDLDGNLNHSIDLPGRLWGLEWDSTGRYILIPGALNETSPDGNGPIHILYIYDTSMDQLATLRFGGWVQQVALVTPTVCHEADRAIASLVQHFAEGVTLGPAKILKSREIHLLSFSFVSAEVIGGAHDGEIATWALPRFIVSPDNDRRPTEFWPVNEPARSISLDHLSPDIEADFDWMHVDGAMGSRRCVTGR